MKTRAPKLLALATVPWVAVAGIERVGCTHSAHLPHCALFTTTCMAGLSAESTVLRAERVLVREHADIAPWFGDVADARRDGKHDDTLRSSGYTDAF
jgi:hypothetical protein